MVASYYIYPIIGGSFYYPIISIHNSIDNLLRTRYTDIRSRGCKQRLQLMQQSNIRSVVWKHGEVSERLKEHDWKSCVRETVPRVQIPLSPP
ncbi:MAG: hypothetical protein K0Q75_2025 [Anaerospora sp.]|nr:hypothetical protein [Anaerospora sp.]